MNNVYESTFMLSSILILDYEYYGYEYLEIDKIQLAYSRNVRWYMLCDQFIFYAAG